MAIKFASFDEAVKGLPKCIDGFDPMGQHRTIEDLAFLVQHEIDLYVDGEENTISCRRQSDTSRRYHACKNFLARCEASSEAA